MSKKICCGKSFFMETPLNRRIFVFAVRNRQRLMNKSGLYVPNSHRGNLTRAEDVFVLSAAKDCRSPWKMGQHVLLSDAFELEPIDLDLWEKYQDEPAFSKLKEFADKVKGKVICTVTHEESILGEVEGDLFQEDTMW